MPLVSGWTVAAGGTWVVGCSQTLTLPFKSHIWLEFNGLLSVCSSLGRTFEGHVNMGSSWCYGSPYINNLQSGPVPFDYGQAHSYNTNAWETFGSMRTFTADAGPVTGMPDADLSVSCGHSHSRFRFPLRILRLIQWRRSVRSLL
jgi:hypothetical protein